MRICFFGTPDFAAHSLHNLVKNGYNDILVITAPDKPAGRGMKLTQSEVKKTALELGLTVLQPEKLKSEEFIAQLKAFDPELGIVIAFRMLPEIVWNLPKLGTFNLHASLLPQYRGAAPIHHAVINGETESGVTTFFLKHEIDTGDIMLQEKISIGRQENTGQLYQRMMEQGADLVLKTLELVKKGETNGTPQSEHDVLIPAPKLNRAFCELVDLSSSETIYNKIRGLSPFPGAWIKSENGAIFKILATEEPESTEHAEAQNLYVTNKNIWLGCGDGKLKISQIQPEGKRALSANEFLNGMRVDTADLVKL